MNRDEFLSLPPKMALRVLIDAIDDDTMRAIEAMEKPKVPPPPKYDFRIYRKDGFMWASETDSEGLRYWHKRYSESALREGNEYAAKDKKNVAEMDRWLAWRECEPSAAWSGERNRERTIAAPPSNKPMVYANQRNGQRAAPPPDTSADVNLDDDIPF
jgi:hypothetical protein